MSGIESIKQILGKGGYIENPADMEPYVKSWRGGYEGKPALIAFPDTTEKVAAIVKLCAGSEIGIVPQGGNSGLVAGAIPSKGGNQVMINLSRMNKVREIDLLNYTVTVEAGCILQNLQNYVKDKDRYFPLSMASEGSAEIGGVISTNAGGTAVLKYGTTRDLVLGLEVVLPNGEILNCLRSLRKDNTGYNLNYLFIGAEGTLGIVTAAIFKISPPIRQRQTLFMAIPHAEAALELLSEFRVGTGDNVTAFEIISESCLDLVVKHVSGARRPFSEIAPWYVLADIASSQQGEFLREQCENIAEKGIEKELINNCVLAESEDQRKQFWHLRETISEAEKKEGRGIHFDISLPVSKIPDFLDSTDIKIKSAMPHVRIVTFGHIGDGNLHYNMSLNKNVSDDEYRATKEKLKEIIYAALKHKHGSISAEHGIGIERKADLQNYKTPVELDTMKKLKAALDPKNIMNPGKIF